MEEWTPPQAAQHVEGRLQLRQIQQACRNWHESGGTKGLRCRKEGEGRRANYFIRPEDLVAYLASERRPGWRKGQPRPKKSAAPAKGGA